MVATWQLAGVLPVGQLDHIDLLNSQSAEELNSTTLKIVTSLDETLQEMMSQQSADDGPVP